VLKKSLKGFHTCRTSNTTMTQAPPEDMMIENGGGFGKITNKKGRK
jgi:hypothetical protein